MCSYVYNLNPAATVTEVMTKCKTNLNDKLKSLFLISSCFSKQHCQAFSSAGVCPLPVGECQLVHNVNPGATAGAPVCGNFKRMLAAAATVAQLSVTAPPAFCPPAGRGRGGRGSGSSRAAKASPNAALAATCVDQPVAAVTDFSSASGSGAFPVTAVSLDKPSASTDSATAATANQSQASAPAPPPPSPSLLPLALFSLGAGFPPPVGGGGLSGLEFGFGVAGTPGFDLSALLRLQQEQTFGAATASHSLLSTPPPATAAAAGSGLSRLSAPSLPALAALQSQLAALLSSASATEAAAPVAAASTSMSGSSSVAGPSAEAPECEVEVRLRKINAFLAKGLLDFSEASSLRLELVQKSAPRS